MKKGSKEPRAGLRTEGEDRGKDRGREVQRQRAKTKIRTEEEEDSGWELRTQAPGSESQ